MIVSDFFTFDFFHLQAKVWGHCTRISHLMPRKLCQKLM